MKKFEEYLQESTVISVSPNPERAKSLVAESERRMSSLQERLKKIGVHENNANDYVEYCYDMIMHLIRAKLYLEGYSTTGQGAHEAEVSYLRKLDIKESEVLFMDQLRYYRNRILYYGKILDEEYAQKVIEFTQRIVPLLKKIIK